MTSLTQSLSDLVGAAFAAEDLPAELGRVQRSDRPDLGQFQCNGAMQAAKIAKAPPRAVAERVAARLEQDPALAGVSVAGPGFLNFSYSDAVLRERVGALAADPRLGVPAAAPTGRVVLDFGGPNVAKPMHVGHLRSAIIGDALQRLFRHLGDAVTSDVHLGDWGLQMGMLISELEIRTPDLPYFAEGAEGPFPAESPVSLEDLERLYPEASAACKADPARNAQAQAATVALQSGRPGYRALWQHFVDVSVAAVRAEFARMGVRFDLWKGESDAQAAIAPLIARMREAGLAEESEGALVVRVAEEGDKNELPPVILQSSQGSALYHTTDLATILDRVSDTDPDLILYVVDQRQHVHFEQVFRAARKGAIAGRAALEHVGFGTVNGPDGKPFKTREGGVMKLEDLMEMARTRAAERIAEAGLAADLDADAKARIAHQIGVGAVKFADLSNHRLSAYIFDLDRFVQFEGKTGPYLQYAAVRIKSLLARAEAQGMKPGTQPSVESDSERALALELDGLQAAMRGAYEKRAPNILCEYVYGLAQAFSRFYTEHHILSEPDEGLRARRLALAHLTLRAVVQVLELLGIDVPDRM